MEVKDWPWEIGEDGKIYLDLVFADILEKELTAEINREIIEEIKRIEILHKRSQSQE